MEKMGRLQFLDLFTELTVHHRRLESLEHLNVFYCISSLALRSHLWTLRMASYFYKVSFFSLKVIHDVLTLDVNMYEPACETGRFYHIKKNYVAKWFTLDMV